MSVHSKGRIQSARKFREYSDTQPWLRWWSLEKVLATSRQRLDGRLSARQVNDLINLWRQLGLIEKTVT